MLLRQSARTDQDRKPCMHWSCWSGPAGRRLFQRGMLCRNLDLAHRCMFLLDNFDTRSVYLHLSHCWTCLRNNRYTWWPQRPSWRRSRQSKLCRSRSRRLRAHPMRSLRSTVHMLLRQSARTDQDHKPCMRWSCWSGPAGRRLSRRGMLCTTLAHSDSATILQNTVYKLLILMGQNALERKQANTRGIHSTDLLEHYYLLCQRYSLCTRLAPYCAGIGQRGSSDRSWDHNSHVLVNISPLHRANSFVERIGHCRSRRNN